MTLALFLYQTQNIAPVHSNKIKSAPTIEGIRLEDESVVTGISLGTVFSTIGGMIMSIFLGSYPIGKG